MGLFVFGWRSGFPFRNSSFYAVESILLCVRRNLSLSCFFATRHTGSNRPLAASMKSQEADPQTNPSTWAKPPVYNSCCVIYDGDCPFCSAYVRLTRLHKAVAEVVLLDARSPDQLTIAPALVHNFDLNEGMLLILDGEYFHGADAMNRLVQLTGPIGIVNTLFYWVFGSLRIARAAYPLLRAGRNLTLRALGRSKLSSRGLPGAQ